MGNTTLFGKTYNVVGSTDSNFLIKTKGDLKVQWGNKFINILKNGKIASEGTDLLQTVSSSDDISGDGIYLVSDTNEVWVSINGTKVSTVGSTTYVSYADTQELTAEQKRTALVNIGLFYNTLAEAQSANIQSGLVYVIESQKLYTANAGTLTEFVIMSTTTSSSETTTATTATTKQNIVMPDETYIMSENASENEGFRLYTVSGVSYLEVDNLKCRVSQSNETSEVPSGTIVMFHLKDSSTEIPLGWAICDGNNGTPDLRGRFIKAITAEENETSESMYNKEGALDSELNENNEITLTTDYLPTLTTSEATVNTFSNLVKRTIAKDETGGETGEEVYVAQGKGSSTVHSHTIEGGNKALKIEPRAYALLFIMKL